MTKELSNAEKLIQLEDKGAAALDNAETPEQRDSIAKNLKKMMGNFTKADRTEAAKLRAEMEGQDTDEELFPLRKSMGGLMNQSLLDSQDFNKDTGFPSAGIGSSITAKRGSPTTDFPGDQMKKSLLADERQPYAVGALVKMGTKAAKIILQQASDEVKNIQKTLPKGKAVKEVEENIESMKQADRNQGDELEGYTFDIATANNIENLEKELFKDSVLANSLQKLKKEIYSRYTNKEVADDIYEDALFKVDIKLEENAPNTREVFPEDAIFRDRDLEDPRFEEFGPTKADRAEEDLNPMTSEQKRKSAEALKRAKEQGIPPFNVGGRVSKQEGSLMVPPEMESDMPVDTYPNIPPEEMGEAMASQLPDAEMEDKHMEFVFEESLDDEEQSYLMNALEGDPRLSQIFDKVLTTASEFTGAGKVEGPGTGVSDSIPARLSDGEFVFTDKATEEIGSDNLQTMMDDAERAYDGGMMRKPAQEGGLLLYEGKDENPLSYEKAAQDEIKKDMLRSNRAPSLNPG